MNGSMLSIPLNTHKCNAEHDHPGDPEEQDVVARLHEVQREELGQVRGVFRPTEG